MKRWIAMLLCFSLLLCGLPALAEEAAADEEAAAQAPDMLEIALMGRPVSEDPTHIRIGSTTKADGLFFTEMWSNNTTDIDLRALVHGYNLVCWTTQYEFITDPMVVETVTTKESKGDLVYTIKLQEDLTYCDGETAITARDYVFSILLCASPVAASLGAASSRYEQLVGFDAYHTGESETFSGIRLIDDYTFSIAVSGDFEPFFYDYANLWAIPYPISVVAPGCAVWDDGDGSYIGNADPAALESPFTAELLQQTVFDEETGVMYAPKLTSGPYMLLSFDRAEGSGEFALNPYYKGNYAGVKPVIDEISFMVLDPTRWMEQLENGEVDLINKVVNKDDILKGMALNGSGFASENYARIGYGFCAFACERGVTASLNVRQAIAYSVDTTDYVQEILDSFGMPVYAYYGIGQWMTLAALGTLRPETVSDADTARWDAITLDSLNHYDPDPEKAKALLIADGWTLNSQGGDYDETTDTVRCKDVDGVLTPLSIRFAKVIDNVDADAIVERLQASLPALGFEFIVEDVTFTDMLSDYYRRGGERKYDMNFMATNFLAAFDPYPTFSVDSLGGTANNSGIVDPELEALALDLRKTEPMDFLTYEEKWLAFQQRFNEVLPTLPLYSNIYFDFFSDWLQNYHPNAFSKWPEAILYAYWAEPEEVTVDDALDSDTFEEDTFDEYSDDEDLLIID